MSEHKEGSMGIASSRDVDRHSLDDNGPIIRQILHACNAAFSSPEAISPRDRAAATARLAEVSQPSLFFFERGGSLSSEMATRRVAAGRAACLLVSPR